MELPAAVCKLSDLKPGSDSVSESQLHASPLTRLPVIVSAHTGTPVPPTRQAFGFGCLSCSLAAALFQPPLLDPSCCQTVEPTAVSIM